MAADFHLLLGDAIARYGWRQVADYLEFPVPTLEFWLQELKLPAETTRGRLVERFTEIDLGNLVPQPIPLMYTMPDYGDQVILLSSGQFFRVVEISPERIVVKSSRDQDYQRLEEPSLFRLRYRKANTPFDWLLVKVRRHWRDFVWKFWCKPADK